MHVFLLMVLAVDVIQDWVCLTVMYIIRLMRVMLVRVLRWQELLVNNVSHMYAPFLGKFVDGLSIGFLEGNNSFRAEEFVNFCRDIDRAIVFLKGFLGGVGVVFLEGSLWKPESVLEGLLLCLA